MLKIKNNSTFSKNQNKFNRTSGGTVATSLIVRPST